MSGLGPYGSLPYADREPVPVLVVDISGVIAPVGTMLTGGAGLDTVIAIGVIAPSGTISRRTSKRYSGSITPAGTVGRMVLRAARLVSGSITPSGTTVIRVRKAFVGTITPANVFLRNKLRRALRFLESFGFISY